MIAPRRALLIVSNGHGEDAVGAAIARSLPGRIEITAYPLVGLGDAYHEVALLEPRRASPSGGFGMRGSWRGLLSDVRAGGFTLWRQQRRALELQRGRHQIVLAVGDVYCLWMAVRAGPPCIFVATAKSQYNEPHRRPELWFIRQHAAMTFARDAPTADALRARHIAVRHAGNPLLDIIPPAANALPLPAGVPAVLLLPGSRADAARNAQLLLKASLRINAAAAAGFVCVPPATLPLPHLIRAAVAVGWEVDGEVLRLGHTAVLVTRDFGAALQSAAIALGLAGTANEQAAGRGIPVVAFPPPGAVQFTPRFLALQQRLLGDALVSASGWESAADAVVRLVEDAAERERRGTIGRTRMGHPGAVPAIVKEILAMSEGSPRADA